MEIHKIEGYIQTIYLVEYPKKLLILDGACRPDVEVICDYIVNTLNRPITDLKLVVSTHMHPDHAGAAHKLRAISGCKIAAANVTTNWYAGFDGYLMFLTDMALAKWVAKRKGKNAKLLWYNRILHADILLEDNQVLPDFEDWQCIYTQGHTDRDISLFHLDSQRLYVADLIVKVKGKYISPFPVFYPNRYKSSLQRISVLNASSIILAHGGEVNLTDSEFEYLKSTAPDQPATHWRSVKKKLLKVLS